MNKKRVFISFDYDHDESLKNLLVGQARNSDSPFCITDMSIKEAIATNWKEKACRRIKVFLSSKIVTVSPQNQAERFCQGVRPLLNE